MKFLKENSYDIVKLFLSQIALAVFALVMSLWTYALGNNTIFLSVGMFCIIFYAYLLGLMMFGKGRDDWSAVSSGRQKPNYLKGFFMSLAANIINIICGIMIFVFSFFIIYQQPVQILDNTNAEAKLYYKSDDKMQELDNSKIFSDTGDTVYSYDNGSRLTDINVDNNRQSPVTLFDKDENQVQLYSKSGDPVNFSFTDGTPAVAENWATDWYGVPAVIATFTQSMFKAVHAEVFNNADWFYLIMPIIPILVCTLSYILGVKGKKVFLFPEQETKAERFR